MTDKNELLAELAVLREKITKNDQLFDLTDDEDVAEALIYERKALNVRLSRVIALAKENGIYVTYEERTLKC